MRTELRSDLATAMRARDTITVSALRSALAAIENAEAVEAPDVELAPGGDENVAGSTRGLGAGELQRKLLSLDDERGLVQDEVRGRRASALHYEQLGRPEQAERLRSEANVLAAYLGGSSEPTP